MIRVVHWFPSQSEANSMKGQQKKKEKEHGNWAQCTGPVQFGCNCPFSSELAMFNAFQILRQSSVRHEFNVLCHNFFGKRVSVSQSVTNLLSTTVAASGSLNSSSHRLQPAGASSSSSSSASWSHCTVFSEQRGAEAPRPSAFCFFIRTGSRVIKESAEVGTCCSRQVGKTDETRHFRVEI